MGRSKLESIEMLDRIEAELTFSTKANREKNLFAFVNRLHSV